MKKIKLGILGTSEIAFRRFLPALKEVESFEYVGVASREIVKTKTFIAEFGGIGFSSYDELIDCEGIDAVYIPLPPALHFEWAKKALKKGKHVLLEKPFTTSLKETEELIDIAINKNLAIHENYMFQYHSQLEEIQKIVKSGQIGDVRLYRIAFGFPKRGESDFRYNKELGGGALLDCGGYTVRLASILLGETAKVTTAKLNYVSEYEVDLYGSATMENRDGVVAQLSFGMDNCYKCDLEVWGSKGNIFANRIFTAPTGFEPEILIKDESRESKVNFESDNQFLNSIKYFKQCIDDSSKNEKNINEIYKQQRFIDDILGREV